VPTVGINIPTFPFNFNCWAFGHTQTLPHIEGFTNTAVTKTSSSHRGIHQLLLQEYLSHIEGFTNTASDVVPQTTK